MDSGNCSWASHFLPSRGECPNGGGGDGIPLQMLAAIAHLAKATVCSMNCVSTNLIYTQFLNYEDLSLLPNPMFAVHWFSLLWLACSSCMSRFQYKVERSSENWSLVWQPTMMRWLWSWPSSLKASVARRGRLPVFAKHFYQMPFFFGIYLCEHIYSLFPRPFVYHDNRFSFFFTSLINFYYLLILHWHFSWNDKFQVLRVLSLGLV